MINRIESWIMRKKVTIYGITGGKIIYKGYEDKEDNYFLDLYKDDPYTKKIVRQYYPLKYNKVEVHFVRRKNKK